MEIISLQYKKRRGGGGETLVEFGDGSILSLDAELAVRFQLKSRMTLNADKFAQLQMEQSRLSARRRLIRHLSLRRKTRREAENYLRELKFPEDAVLAAINVAMEQGYLDDADYTQAYVRGRERSAKKGPRAIFHELAAKGIAPDLANSALEASRDPEIQRARALEAGRRKAAALDKNEPRAARQKLTRFLIGKGYDHDIVFDVTHELLGESQTEDEISPR